MPGKIDLIRASNDGHAFHYAWAARSALELVDPSTDLQAISMEGFSSDDEGMQVSGGADEVADLVRYRGARRSQAARRIEVVQFKYSIVRADVSMRASDAAKTIEKFAAAFRDFTKELGADRVREVLRFELVTNRPILPSLTEAIAGLRLGNAMDGEVADQARAIAAASGLAGDDLRDLAAMLSLIGGRGTVGETVAQTGLLIANWGAASDTLARQRLLALQRLVTDKAGSAGQLDNRIVRVDVLGALEVADERELFPAEAAFPSVERVIPREATDQLLAKVAALKGPLIVHGVGGMGKTVLMQSLVGRLSESSLVVLFDGFGAGRWRDPEDGRHLPQRALVQLVNQIASRGLCDLLLPGSTNPEDLVRTFRRRLEQAVSSLAGQGFGGGVVLLLDAIDHSAMRASATQGQSFAILLLETFSVSPLNGVRVVGSCRTERLEITKRMVECDLFEVPPFNYRETEALVLARYPAATAAEIAAAHSRSNGNPRVLNMVLMLGPPFEVSQVGPRPSLEQALDVLIQEQVLKARENARSIGALDHEIDAVLAGLAFLPPPVPVEELAAAQGMTVPAVQSFVADLFPLIEQTPHGLIFRDEPIETYIRNRASLDATSQAEVLKRLDQRQEASSYAARAYPAVLRELGRKAQLYDLALDDRLPATAASGVAKRAIRLARLEAALHVAATDGDREQLMRITLELARVAEGHGRSDKYLRENPDLVAISEDPESVRRLFEDRGGWPGGRHASLAVANLMVNEKEEAHRHAWRSLEWNDWRARLKEEEQRHLPRSRLLDVYGPAWVAISFGDTRTVGDWLLRWHPPQGFGFAAEIVRLSEEHAYLSTEAAKRRDRLYRALGRMKQPPTIFLLAVLSRSRSLSPQVRNYLTARLVSATDITDLGSLRESRGELDGLQQAFVGAAAHEFLAGRTDAALILLDKASLSRPHIYAFDPPVTSQDAIGRWLLAALFRATAKGNAFSLADMAPEEIDALVRRKADRKAPEKYLAALKAAMAKPPARRRRRRSKTALDSETMDRLRRFIDKRSGPVIAALGSVQADLRKGDAGAAVKRLLDTCDSEFKTLENYPYRDNRRFANQTVSDVAFQLASATDGIRAETAERIRAYLEESEYRYLPNEIGVVSMLAAEVTSAPSALKLAVAVNAKLASETSVDTRIGRMGELGRAVWPASLAEARSYFVAGLQLADRFSSDDIDETLGLLALAEEYRGPRLPPEITHEFARICEMQMPDDADRFDWRGHAFALARIGGLEGLAISCRLSDRGRSGIDYNHLMICAALTEAQKLDADLAAVLVGVHSYTDWRAFRITDYLERLLPKLTPQQQSILIGYAASEVDRLYGAGGPSDLAESLNKLGSQYLDVDRAIRQRFAQLAGESNGDDEGGDPGLLNVERGAPVEQEEDALAAIVAAADVSSGEGLETAVAKLPAAGRAGRPIAGFLRRLAERQALPDDRIRFLNSLEQAQSFRLDDKLIAVDGVLFSWVQASVAVRSHVTEWAKALAARHAADLTKGGWDGSYLHRRLIEMTGGAVADDEIAVLVLQHVDGRASQIARTAWLRFARQLVRSASPQALADGLSRYVMLSAKTIPEEFGDGPWATAFGVVDDQVQSIAGLLWSQLGAPDVRKRWRAAHAVRRSVELQRPDVLAALIARIDSTDAGVFHDRSSEFFFLNAKLWLLLAVARIALSQPQLILPYRATLEGIAFSTELPHVLMRELAARALVSISDCLGTTEARELKKRCKGVNASPFPMQRKEHYYGDGFYDRPPEGYKRDREFHFDYDFDKSQLKGLARVFGTHRYETGDKVAAWVHRWSPHATNMWSGRNGDDDGWKTGRQPVVEGWNSHLAWHGIFLAAGEILLTHPLIATRWEHDPWGEWMRGELLSRPDARWLADDAGLTPGDIGNDLTGGDTPVPRRSLDLLSLVGLDRPDPEWIVVDGQWDTADNVDVWMRSATVPQAKLKDAAFALTLLNGHDVWLPRKDDVDGSHHDMRPFRPWLEEVEHARESGIDASDPYATRSSRSDVRPTERVIAMAGLTPSVPFARTWSDGQSVLFKTEAWGRVRGRGRYEEVKSGRRALAHRSLLQAVSAAGGGSLVVLIFARRYLKEKHGDAAFPSRWLLVTIDRDGRARPVVRIPKAVRQAVRAMDAQSRRDFGTVLRTVRNARPAAPKARRKS